MRAFASCVCVDVGLCFERDYPRFRYSIVLIATHVISDVYLMLVLATMAGLYLGDDPHHDGFDTNADGWC